MAKVAIDIHVIEGRPQGTRTTLTKLLQAVAALGLSARFELVCSDAKVCKERIGRSEFVYKETGKGNAVVRLLFNYPLAILSQNYTYFVWQYISSPISFSRNYVFIHDVLPFSHAHLFPKLFRIRCVVLFTLSMIFASKIITVSEFGKREISKLSERFGSKTVVVPNGPSFSIETYFKVREKEPEKRYILCVGRIEKRKNIQLLLEAFNGANLNDVFLVLVGRADLGFNTSFIRGDRVQWLKDVDDVELINLYRNSSLFVYPSEAEGFGLPALDALLFGLPIIASNTTSIPEVTGGLAAYFDPTAIDSSERLRRMIQDHFLADPLQPATVEERHKISESFNWLNSAKLFTRLFLDQTNYGEADDLGPRFRREGPHRS